MKLFRKFKLAHQILAILLIIPSLIIGVLLYYSAVQHVDVQNKPQEQLAISTSISLSEKTAYTTQQCIADTKSFSVNSLAISSLNKKEADSNLVLFMNKMIVYYNSYELLMLCDLQGNIIAVNSKDNLNNDIASAYLKTKNMNEEEWFRSSIVAGGPKGGAYYSDFNEDDDVTKIYNHKGYGINFSAPVRDENNAIIGVWRSRASWTALTRKIRKEAEQGLQKNAAGAIIVLFDKQGHLIDAKDENALLKLTIGKNNLFKNYPINLTEKNINEDDYLYGWSENIENNGIAENKWHFLTLIPKIKLSNKNIYLHSDWTKLTLLSFALLLFVLIISIFFVTKFSNRINKIKEIILTLSRGELIQIDNIKSNDEISEMSLAINELSQSFTDIANFSNEIGKGNLSAKYKLLGDNDLLGNSLLKMQENLLLIEKENNEQKFSSEKLGKLNDLIRIQEDSDTKLKKIISFLVKSINGFQGSLFVINQTEFPIKIELKAGFALSAHQMDSKPFLFGETIIGQCIKDNELQHISNLPENYINHINSGLGEAIPKSLIIIPINYNKKSEGAIEIATFKDITAQQINFLEVATEYLGAYIVQCRIDIQEKDYNYSNTR